MSFSFNGLNSQVTISGAVTTSASIAQPSSTQTLVNVKSAGNGSNQNTYTVPAGKTFYLMGYWVEGTAQATINIYATDGSTMRITANNNGASQPYPSINHYSPFPLTSYAAAENVVCKVTNGFNYGIIGYYV